MDTRQRFVQLVVENLSGAKSGSVIGTTFVGVATLADHKANSSLL